VLDLLRLRLRSLLLAYRLPAFQQLPLLSALPSGWISRSKHQAAPTLPTATQLT